MRKKLIESFLLATLAMPVFAGENSGVRGGGHVIEVNNKLELTDLVTTAKCDWYQGHEIIKNNPEIGQILNKIEKLDWYFALEIQREIEFLSWCMTGNLYSVPAFDKDSFIKQLTKGVQQVAFRYNKDAFIDFAKFNQLSPKSQAYLIIHETLHSYLPMDLEMRIFKLQSIVSTILNVDLGKITTTDALHFNLEKNEIDFPLTSRELEPYKNEIKSILGSRTDRFKAILNSPSPEKLISKKIQRSIRYLANWDKKSALDPQGTLEMTILEIFRENNLKQIRFILNSQEYSAINPASVGISIFEKLSPSVQKEIMSSKYFSKIVQSGIDFLNSIDFKISNGRILSNLNLQQISSACDQSVPNYTTSLNGISSNPNCTLPLKIKAIVGLIAILIEQDELDVLKKMVEDNDDFINAVRMKKTLSLLKNINSPILREKEVAIEAIQIIQRDLKDAIQSEVLKKTSAGAEDIITNLFNKI